MKVKAVYHADGVYIRAFKERKYKYKKLFTIDKDYWDGSGIKSKHSRHNYLNKDISDALKKYNDIVFKLSSASTEATLKEVFSKPKPKRSLAKAISQYANMVRQEGKFN